MVKRIFCTLIMATVALSLWPYSERHDCGSLPVEASKSIVILFEGDTHCEPDGYSRFACQND